MTNAGVAFIRCFRGLHIPVQPATAESWYLGVMVSLCITDWLRISSGREQEAFKISVQSFCIGLTARPLFPALHDTIESCISLNVQFQVAKRRHQRDNFKRANYEENITKTGNKTTCKKQDEAAWRGLANESQPA